jgi:hypothetical protein
LAGHRRAAPLALMLHGEPHPRPLKCTVEFPASKFDPVSVRVNNCPLTAGFGEVAIALMLGATGALDTVSETPPEVNPVGNGRRCTDRYADGCV